MYPPFLEPLEAVLESAPSGDCLGLLANFSADVCSNNKTWRGMVRKKGPSDLNPSGALLLDICARNGLSITNTMFRHKGVHMCTWHQDTLGRSSMINIVVASNYRGITLLSGKVNLGVVEKRVRRIVEPWIWEEQCGPALYPQQCPKGCVGVCPTGPHVI